MEIPRAALERIAKDFGLDAIILFGSQARGFARPDSDVDVCVVGGRADDDLDLQAELGIAFGRNLDLVRFETSDPVLRYHSVFRGTLLWGSRRLFDRLRLRALKEWQDSRKIDEALTAYLDHRS